MSHGEPLGNMDQSEGTPTLSRRDFIRLLGTLTAVGLAPQALIACGPQPPVVNPTATPGAIQQPVPTVTNPGARVPDITVTYQSSAAWMNDFWRKIALDGQKLGLNYKLNAVATSAWLNSFYAHTYGDVTGHSNDSRDYRDSDPTEHLVARLHSREAQPPLRNLGEYKNPELDKLAEAVESELDPQKRLQAAYQIQEIMARDYYIWCSCTGPDPINAYNSTDWENVVATPGNSIAGPTYVWNWFSVRPKTGRKRVIYAVANLDKLSVTNPFGPGGVRGVPSQLYFDKMIALSPEVKPIPWVLTEWKMIDNLNWELTVRDGIKWHDGQPATADDVAFTFNYIAKWKPSFYDAVFQAIASAEAINPRTVRVKTTRPAANMVSDLLIRTPLIAKHIWENAVERQNVKDPSAVQVSSDMIVGTGPFKFDHFTQDVELLVKANPNHWMAPKIDELLMVQVPSLDSMLGKLENKEVDFEDQPLTPSQANRLKAQSHISLVSSSKILNPFFITFFDHLPWRDSVFRKAWHRTLDKEYLVNVIWEGAGKVQPFNSLMGPAHPFHNPNITTRFKYNLDEARQLLAQGGYSWDKEGRLLYPGADNADYKKRVDNPLLST